MKKKVCHVTSVHSYLDERVYYKECVSLAKIYEVYLVAPNCDNQELSGVHVRGVELPKGRLKRVLNLKRLEPTLIDIDAEIYHFHDPELLYIGYRMKRRGKNVIFDSHEDVPMQIISKDWLPIILRRSISTIYKLIERFILKRYTAVISVTPSIVQRLQKINSNTYQITNYPIYKDCQDERKWSNIIVFTGGISSQWMHLNVLDSIKDLNVVYLLAGRPEGEYLEKMKNHPSWSKVDFRGLIKHTEVNQFIQQASAGVALNDYVPNVGYKLGSLGNTKIFEYMMAGLPVIGTDFILWKEILEGYNCGICVNPHEIQSISNAIKTLTENPKLAKEMGDNGKRAVKEKYNWSEQEKVLFDVYEKILAL